MKWLKDRDGIISFWDTERKCPLKIDLNVLCFMTSGAWVEVHLQSAVSQCYSGAGRCDF